MDAKVKEFLETAKAKEREEFEKKRDKHLISLGLIKETKKEYSDYYNWEYATYDDEVKKYYRKVHIPVEVTDEEYDEILRVSPPATKIEEVVIEDGAERFLGVMNVISLIVGIIAALVLVFVAMDSYRNGGYYFMGGVALLLMSLISWAIVKVILNISDNLHKINSKLK